VGKSSELCWYVESVNLTYYCILYSVSWSESNKLSSCHHKELRILKNQHSLSTNTEMFFRKCTVVTLNILYASRIGFIKRKTVVYFFYS